MYQINFYENRLDCVEDMTKTFCCFFSVHSVEDVIVKLDGVNNKHTGISENNSDISDRVLHLYYDEINLSFIDAFHVFVG